MPVVGSGFGPVGFAVYSRVEGSDKRHWDTISDKGMDFGIGVTTHQKPWERWAGGVLVAALVIFVTGAAIGFLAPSLRDAPPFVTDDVGEVAAAIAGNPTAWAWASGLILSAALITALGLVPITFQFEGKSRPWAFTGLVAFAFGAVFEVIVGFIAIGVIPWAATRYPDPVALAVYEAFDEFSAGLGVAFAILAFVAIGLYGNAMRRTEATTRLGWAFVAGATFGVVLEVVGFGIPGFIYLGTAALGVAIWRRGRPTPPPQISGN